MKIKFDTQAYEELHGDCPTGYANRWIFSLANPVDYAEGVAGLDYLILDDMDYQDAKFEASSWALYNGEGYETLFVSKDAGSDVATIGGA